MINMGMYFNQVLENMMIFVILKCEVAYGMIIVSLVVNYLIISHLEGLYFRGIRITGGFLVVPHFQFW